MTSHTPGPWTAEPNGGDDEDTRSLLVGCNDQYGDFTVIADCRSRWVPDELGGDEEANARLIAAAPDLLVALQSLVIRCEAKVRPLDFGVAVKAARAAIAKAGEPLP